MIYTLLILVYILGPVAILRLCRKYIIFQRIGSVILAYALGLIIGNIGLLPAVSDFFYRIYSINPDITLDDVKQMFGQGTILESDILYYKIRELQDVFTIITIPIALPLLLFSTDIKAWSKLAGITLLSMFLAIVSVVIVVIAGHFVFTGQGIDQLWKVSGMMIGLYSGGTPNLASLKLMLDVDSETYILTHTYDTIVSAAYLFFLISIGKKIFSQFLPRFKDEGKNESEEYSEENANDFVLRELIKKVNFFPLLKTLLIVVGIFGVSGLISFLFPKNMQMLVVILCITTLSILVTLVPKLKLSKFAYNTGIYFILVFSTVVASMADISNLTNSSPVLLYYVCFAIVFSLFLHVLLAKIFKVDADTVMVTSTALICSPPFVPMVVSAINNKKVLVSGLTVGIIGYVVGNYLGVLVAYFLQGI